MMRAISSNLGVTLTHSSRKPWVNAFTSLRRSSLKPTGNLVDLQLEATTQMKNKIRNLILFIGTRSILQLV
jgi:hypothetical protein